MAKKMSRSEEVGGDVATVAAPAVDTPAGEKAPEGAAAKERPSAEAAGMEQTTASVRDEGPRELTKAEAVRMAIKAGKTSPKEGCAWIQEKFGLNVEVNYFSTVKSEVMKAGKGKAAPSKADAVSDVPGDLESLRLLLDKYGRDGLIQMVKAMR